MSTTRNTKPFSVHPGYDNTPAFPSEPGGWGAPGTIRHAEAIGHGAWLAEHPDDVVSTDELIARSEKARVDLAAAVAFSQAARGFADVEPERCPIPTCARLDHSTWEMCEDANGHTWFQGEPQ